MPLAEEITAETFETFARAIEVTKGRVIPAIADLPFGNQGRELQLVALFVDIRRSTQIVNAIGCEPAARMYKAYLRGITKIIRGRGGDILSFNGDGVVAGFVGDNSATAAVLSALNIDWFCHTVLKPKVDGLLEPVSQLRFEYGIGVDRGKVIVVRGGVRGDDNSDLVWAGNPVNYAVKLSSLTAFPHTIHVSEAIMKRMHSAVFWTRAGETMWGVWYWQEKQVWVWRTAWYLAPVVSGDVPNDVET